LPVALLGGAIAHVNGAQTMSTDDAYVKDRQIDVSMDVVGIVPQKRRSRPISTFWPVKSEDAAHWMAFE
jgi:hypothetical protein